MCYNISQAGVDMAKSKTKNSALHRAKEAKADEFYTQLTDIEKEC